MFVDPTAMRRRGHDRQQARPSGRWGAGRRNRHHVDAACCSPSPASYFAIAPAPVLPQAIFRPWPATSAALRSRSACIERRQAHHHWSMASPRHCAAEAPRADDHAGARRTGQGYTPVPPPATPTASHATFGIAQQLRKPAPAPTAPEAEELLPELIRSPCTDARRRLHFAGAAGNVGLTTNDFIRDIAQYGQRRAADGRASIPAQVNNPPGDPVFRDLRDHQRRRARCRPTRRPPTTGSGGRWAWEGGSRRVSRLPAALSSPPIDQTLVLLGRERVLSRPATA